MERHPIIIRFTVSGPVDEEAARDLLNSACFSIQAFSARPESKSNIHIAEEFMEIRCVVTAESFDAAASLITAAFESAKRRDQALDAVELRLFRPRGPRST